MISDSRHRSQNVIGFPGRQDSIRHARFEESDRSRYGNAVIEAAVSGRPIVRDHDASAGPRKGYAGRISGRQGPQQITVDIARFRGESLGAAEIPACNSRLNLPQIRISRDDPVCDLIQDLPRDDCARAVSGNEQVDAA